MKDLINRLPDRLRRVTSGAPLINEIDGLRFLAIFAVLIQHLHERFVRNTTIRFSDPPEDTLTAFVATRGFVGVYVFFVISGFILAMPFAAKRLAGNNELKLRKYYLRRLTRLEPPYFIWMTILFFAYVIVKNSTFGEWLPHLLANLTYTHGLVYTGWSLINPPTWTLEVEVQFYIMAPILAWLFFGVKDLATRRIILVSFIFIFMCVQQYYEFFRMPYYLFVVGYLHIFLIGFVLVDIYLNEWQAGITKKRIFDLIAIISLIGIVAVWDWDFHFIDRLGEVFFLFVFFYSVFRSVWVNRFFTNRWIVVTGGMCYTIYLIHLPLCEALMMITKRLQVTDIYEVNLFVQLLIFLPVVFVVGSISFLLFEKPFMNKDWPKAVKAMFTSQSVKQVS
jgi:peptidoglycan/LPS O-acetylase OafA/YrhL